MPVRSLISIRRRLSAGAALSVLALFLGFPGTASAQAPYAADPTQIDDSEPQAEGDDAVALGPAAFARDHGAHAIGSSAWAWGDEATAVGARATAFGDGATAIGYGTYAEDFSTALGATAMAQGERSISIGWGSYTEADSAMAIGAFSSAQGDHSIAIGDNAYVYSQSGSIVVDGGIAIGGTAVVRGENGIAIGFSSEAFDPHSMAIGGYAMTEGFGSIGIGEQVIVYGDQSLALGYGLQVQGERSMALGSASVLDDMGRPTPFGGVIGDGSTGVGVGALVIADNAVALGAGSLAHEDDTVSVGLDVTKHPLMGLDGSTSFTRRIVNVTDGNIAEGSSDAITGGQLHTVIGSVTANATAISGLDTRLTDAETDILALTAGAGDGLVLQDADGTITVAAATGGAAVSFAGTDGRRQLGGLAESNLAADGDHAVTTGQLFATHQATASALGGGAAFDATGAFTAPSYAILGSAYDNVGGALGALNAQVVTNTADIDTLKIEGGGGGGPVDDGRDQEIAALRAQIQAMSSVLDRLEAGAISGGEATGEGTTAAGEGAVAEQYGDTAFGAGARATGDPSTAVGFASLAAGQHSTAIGGNAEATGDLSTALGQGAIASGANSLALGQGSQATHADSIAIGQGIATTRANQVAIGSSSHTYTLAGVHSDASRAAQSGQTYVVTSDASGNLATMDMSSWFLQVDALETRMDVNDVRWLAAERTLERHADGVAMAIALGGQVLQPGQTFAMSGNLGAFDGHGALGFGAVGRINPNVTLNIGVGTGFRTGVASGRIGVSVGW